MVDIDCGKERNSEDEVEYRCKKENASDNSGDNASTNTVVIADPLLEQTVTLGVRFYRNKVTLHD